MFTKQKLHEIVLLTVVSVGLFPNIAIAQVINFVGANAGNVMAAVPSNNNFVQSGNGLLANGATWGPATQTLTGGAWSGFQENRSVTVENRLNIYSGYSYTRTSFTAGAGGEINPGVVHTFNLHNELFNWDMCCGISSDSRGDVTFRFEVLDPPAPTPNNSTGSNNPNGVPGWNYTPLPIYFVYEWNAEAIRGSGVSTIHTAHTTTGWMADVGDISWTQPQMLSYEPITTGTWSGSRSGVLYTYTGIRDYRFNFENILGSAGSWEPSIMDINIRMAFSDQPFTSIPTVIPTSPVPEPETYGMLLAGLGLLSFTAKRRKQSA